jgi:hypothetical protein
MARARESDPFSELAALEAALARGELARGYVLRGEERYFRERALERIKERAREEGCEPCLHEAEEANPDFRLARLIDDLSGGGLFAPRRLVVVRHGAELLKKVGGEESPLARAVLAFLRDPGSPGTVVLSDPSLRADHPVVRAVLEAGGLVVSLRKLWESPPPWKPDPRNSELVQWTERRARELGLVLSFEQALYVTAATGNDLAALDDQLELLRASGGRDPRVLVPWTAGASPWGVAEHIAAGDTPRALAGIEALFSGGFQDKSGRRVLDASALASMLLGALQRGVRASLALSQALEQGLGEKDALAAAGVGGGPTGERAALARARERPSARWRLLFDQTGALERAAKSGPGVDASDFACLTLRWSLRDPRRR